MVGMWHCSSGTIVRQHQWVRAEPGSTGLVSGAGGSSGGVCVTRASLVSMNSGFLKSQNLRLLADPTSLQPAAISGGDSCLSLKH